MGVWVVGVRVWVVRVCARQCARARLRACVRMRVCVCACVCVCVRESVKIEKEREHKHAHTHLDFAPPFCAAIQQHDQRAAYDPNDLEYRAHHGPYPEGKRRAVEPHTYAYTYAQRESHTQAHRDTQTHMCVRETETGESVSACVGVYVSCE